MTWTEIGGHVAVAAIVIILGYFGSLWKRSIYGRFDEIKSQMAAVESRIENEAEIAKSTAENEVKEAKELAATGIKEIKEMLRKETDSIRLGFVPIALCNSERMGCQHTLFEKIEAINRSMSDKLDLIIQRQMSVIDRMDRHINGHGK